MAFDKVKINIGGTLFVTYFETLQTFPETKLAKLNPECDAYDSVNHTYYFDRDAECFASILSFYRGKELHVPKHICSTAMRKELEFWGISKKNVSQCCWKSFYEVDEDLKILSSLPKAYPCTSRQREDRNLKTKIWLFLDDPSSSFAAKVWNGLYVLIVAVSCVSICLETVSYFRTKPHISSVHDTCTPINNTRNNWLKNPKVNLFFCYDAIPQLLYLEVGCLIFFTAEFIVCFALSPEKKLFFKNPFYDIVMVTLVSMWLDLLFDVNKNWIIDSSTYQTMFIGMKCISTIRVLLLFRMVNNFSPLAVLLLSVKNSCRDLLLLVLCIFLATVIFASFVYQTEIIHESSMPDAFASMWYTVITLTTIGYGDVYPLTNAGKVSGAACALFGLLLLAVPFAVIASTFSAYYSRNKDKLRHFSKRPILSQGSEFSITNPEDNQVTA